MTDEIAALAALTGGRARLSFAAPSLRPLEPIAPGLLAGAAEVDITPPPGLPRAGYSRNAHTGVGFRTRLRARVVHLRTSEASIAIVATDLLGGSAVIQHLVASAVAARTDVPLAGVFLGATHTHGAPGQFHGTDFYNRFSSNQAGFDPRWASFLASRISSAVLEAVSTRQPAALAWGRTSLPGVTRNRSLAAHQRNPGRRGAAAHAAVNPWLELLRVDSSTGVPLAALAVFSIHGTAVPMSSTTYNADLWAYLCAELGSAVSLSHGTRPVTGALQGTHGDLTPALSGPAGHPEAARLGREIGAAAATLYSSLDGSLTSEVRLGAAFRELPSSSTVGGLRLPRRPAVGASLLAGAKENETPVVCLIPPFRAGYGKRPAGVLRARGPQGAKWVVGSRWLQPLLLPLNLFPRVLPLHVLRIGSVLLAGVPMEVTLESGLRIAAAVSAGFGPGSPLRTVVSSVADEYAGYCTTAEEYGAQYYEGGHTLYGPTTQAFVAAALGELAGSLAASAGMVQQTLPERSFDLRVRHYLTDSAVSPAAGLSVGPAARPTVAPAAGPSVGRSVAPAAGPTVGPAVSGVERATGERFVEWQWAPAGPVVWHEPLVRLETPWGPIEDDGFGALETVRSGTGYATRWYTSHVEGVAQVRFTQLT